MMEEKRDFLSELYEEKITSQKRRGDLVIKKLSWVTGLLAAGVINLKIVENELKISTETSFLVYVVPVISLVFDLYILGENYGIKRMGCFIRLTMRGTVDGDWETFVSPRRDVFSGFALFFSSLIILISSAIVLWYLTTDHYLLYIWVVILFILLISVHSMAFRQLSALDKMTYQKYLEGRGLVYKHIFGYDELPEVKSTQNDGTKRMQSL